MKGGIAYMAAGGMAVLALGAALSAGFLQDRTPARGADRIAIGAPLSERQALERRRANVGVVAVAGTTAQ